MRAAAGSDCALIAAQCDEGDNTKRFFREHGDRHVAADYYCDGGKWTTYRAMAEDVLLENVSKAVAAPGQRAW